MRMEEANYIKELLETKLDSFGQKLEIEMDFIKKEIEKLEANIYTNSCNDQERALNDKATAVRLHTRLDQIEEEQKKLRIEIDDVKTQIQSGPKRQKAMEIIRTKSLEWLVPAAIMFFIWIVANGVLGSFFNFMLHLGTK